MRWMPPFDWLARLLGSCVAIFWQVWTFNYFPFLIINSLSCRAHCQEKEIPFKDVVTKLDKVVWLPATLVILPFKILVKQTLFFTRPTCSLKIYSDEKVTVSRKWTFVRRKSCPLPRLPGVPCHGTLTRRPDCARAHSPMGPGHSPWPCTPGVGRSAGSKERTPARGSRVPRSCELTRRPDTACSLWWHLGRTNDLKKARAWHDF